MWDTSTCCITTVTTDLSGINRASDYRSQRKKSNFTEFLGTNLWKNRPISQEFSGQTLLKSNR